MTERTLQEVMSPSPMKKLLAFSALLVLAISGCGGMASRPGTFDRTLNVSGPVRLELTNGSGDVRIARGAEGVVHIHCEFRVTIWPWENAEQRVAQISAHPPVEQDENLVRIGNDIEHFADVQFNYTIEVPENAEVRARTGSGDVEVHGIHGPVNLMAGSGDVTARQIGDDTQAITGSGSVQLEDIQGEVEATAGSGDLTLANISGETRVRAGSGDIIVNGPGKSLSVSVGSGDVKITNAFGDLRIHAGSGDISVKGSPASAAYWEFHSGSGDISLEAPPTASFRLYAHSSFGKIQATLPIEVEEKTASHKLRGIVGDGRARVEIETSSGDIQIR